MEVEDLRVYKKLFALAFSVNKLTMTFPKFELYELGSQLRRASNSCPANLAEGFDNKHTNIYLECINRSKAEAREVKHHLKMCYEKKYITKEQLIYLLSEYDESSKMLYGLSKSLLKKHKK